MKGTTMKRTLMALAAIALVFVVSACLYPDNHPMALPYNTGVPSNVTLTSYTGPMVITTANTTIDSKLVQGCLDIRAANVTIIRTKIQCDATGDESNGIENDENSAGLVVTNVEITSSDPGVKDLRRAIQLRAQATISKVYIHHATSGIGLWQHSGTTITDSYIGDSYASCMPNCTAQDPHGSGIGSNGGMHNLTIRYNNINMDPASNASSAISLYDETWAGGSGDTFLIEKNILGGGSYTVYLSGHTNMVFTNNWFNSMVAPVYGPVASWSPNNTGNVWDDNYYVTYDTNQNKAVTTGAEIQP